MLLLFTNSPIRVAMVASFIQAYWAKIVFIVVAPFLRFAAAYSQSLVCSQVTNLYYAS